MTSVLDCWAVLAVLRDEPARPRVVSAIEAGGARISWINLGEVAYQETRRLGSGPAEVAIERLHQVLIADEADGDAILEAAAIKAEHPISYADCFAVATAERHRAPLLTGDPEILSLDRPGLELVDLRA